MILSWLLLPFTLTSLPSLLERGMFLDICILIFRFDGSHIATLKAKDSSFSFTSFAKSNNWGEDLCENLVSPYYKQGFFWETWRRNPPLPSYCPPVHKYEELNINYVALPGTNYKWHYTQDHSKWGVSAIASQPITCVGGINRMESQRKRGGGTVCQTYSPMWRAMYALISQADNCWYSHHKWQIRVF